MTIRETKLIQYLNEAYGKERELETALRAHIAMTTRAPYRKRLQEHLRETKGHAREVQRRIKQLGGKAEIMPAPGPDVVSGAAGAVTSAASKAVSAAKGPLHVIRGTGEAERMLKNAKTEYWNEFEEIATYNAIETLAEEVGDDDTAKLARGIRREEQKMANFLEKQIPTLTKAVAREEIPSSERKTTRRRRSSRRRSSSGGGSRTRAGSRSGSSGRSRSSSSSRSSASSRGGGARSGGSSRGGSSRSGSSRGGSSRSGSSRSGSSRSGSSRSGSSRSGSSRGGSRASSSRRRSS
jgi:ferritin-like metal-binding protein YciE